MGCGTTKFAVNREHNRSLPKQTPFPLSSFQKNVIKNSWPIIERNKIAFGTGIFIRLFSEHFEMAPLFPEFKGLQDIEELKGWTELIGHPRKIFNAFSEAVQSIDDGVAFIEKMEKLGEKHSSDIKEEYLKRMGEALVATISDVIPEDEMDPYFMEAWIEFYRYISRLMIIGIRRRLMQDKNDAKKT